MRVGTYALGALDSKSTISDSDSFESSNVSWENKPSFIWQTSTGAGETSVLVGTTGEATFRDTILSETKGIILSYDADMVQIKLSSGVKVILPKKIFANPESIQGGASVAYKIIRDYEGYKSQLIEVDASFNPENGDEEIKKILEEF